MEPGRGPRLTRQTEPGLVRHQAGFRVLGTKRREASSAGDSPPASEKQAAPPWPRARTRACRTTPQRQCGTRYLRPTARDRLL
jgi:hypothetical protein